MRFAINTPNFGSFSDVRLMAELAHEAEDAGWDGFFVWDHIGGSSLQAIPMADPWVALTAMAMTTSRIKLGPIVTPLPRRRPWKLARERDIGSPFPGPAHPGCGSGQRQLLQRVQHL